MEANPYDEILSKQASYLEKGYAPIEALLRTLLDGKINFRFEVEDPEEPGHWLNVTELLAACMLVHERALAEKVA